MDKLVNKEKQTTNCQKNENPFLCVYINNFVKIFRSYNNDKFNVSISGLESFVYKEDKVLTYLFKQLKKNNFVIEFYDYKESINHIDITCSNITKNTSYNFKYQIQDLPTIIDISSKTNIPTVGIIIMKVIAQIISKLKILYKAVVLDLDDTLWKGTLSEIGIDEIIENMSSKQGTPYIEFMKFIKTLANDLGIFIAICSRNDSKQVESSINKLDINIFPLKNQIDYIIANNNDKSENIKTIAKHLSILPKSIVFIDDNPIIRDQVKHKLPEVFVPEWENHTELLNKLIAGCIFERTELSLNSQKRRKQFKIIQTERSNNTLPTLYVKIFNDNKHIGSTKFYSKTNQFKFSLNNENFDSSAKSLYFEIYRESGENLGVCSAITYTISQDTFIIQNWAVSCRYFGIGLEEFILIYLQKIAINKKIFIKYQHTEYNQKVKELLDKYSDIFNYNDKNDIIEITFTKESLNNIINNSNLKSI